jgi:hypothetical protein
MTGRWSRGARGAAAYRLSLPAVLTAALCACALAGCNENGAQLTAAQPRGATVAFESIDGPPQAQFHKLVQDLNDEAQTRRLAVMSREQPSAYRVRGYLAADVAKGATTISWVWDVFDGEQQRSLRITGAETVKGRHRDAWQAVDDAMLRRIAQSSMSELAAFLTSAEAAPGTPDVEAAAQMTLTSASASPEAAGIFRIFRPNADPVPTQVQAEPADDVAAPLPRRRPTPAAFAGGETLLLAAAPAR